MTGTVQVLLYTIFYPVLLFYKHSYIFNIFVLYFFFFSSAFADDEGPFVPPVDLNALDAEIAADKLAQEAEASESCPEQIN